jgi:hypothetical protein
VVKFVLIGLWFNGLCFLICAASALNTLFSGMHSPAQLTQWTAAAGDPCGQNWRGVTCSGSRVTQMFVIFVINILVSCFDLYLT